MFLGAVVGGVVGFCFQYWINVHDYPINIGGKPDFSWPAFIPVTFEMTILFGALTAVLGMLGLNRMPKPYHPVFHVEGFERHTTDRFFLLIRAKDGRFDRRETYRFMEGLAPLRTTEVPR